MRSIIVVLAFAFSTVTTTAHAETPEEKAQALYDEGEAAYKAGKVEEALVAFQAAYDTAPVAGLLFNIGQCHRQLKHHEKAIELFQRYLDEETDIPNRAEIAELISEERAQMDRDKPPPPPPKKEPGEPALWQQPVFWGVAGGAALAVLVGATVAVVVATQPVPPSPQGSLGTFDLRAP